MTAMPLIFAILICFIITQIYVLRVDNELRAKIQEQQYEIENIKRILNNVLNDHK